MRRAVAVIGFLALLVSMTAPPLQARPEKAAAGAPRAAVLRLKAGEVELTRLAADEPALSAGEKGLYVVQFRGPIRKADREMLTARAVAVGSYLPDNAYLVRMTAQQSGLVAAEQQVRAVRRYRAEWKAPGVKADPGEIWVEAFPGAETELAAAARALGATEIRSGQGGIAMRLPQGKAAELARSEAVVFIEPVRPVQKRNDVAAGLIAISEPEQVWAAGLSGQGQLVGVADTGLDTGDPATLHADLAPNLATAIARGRPGDWSDPDGHGTHVSGSVVGNGANSGGQIRGMAPDGRLVFQSVLDAGGGLGGIGDVYDLLSEAYQNGARLHSDSWGVPYEWGGWTYDGMAQDVDQFVWEHRDLTVLFAAGNDGDWDSDGATDLNTVATPATAKNILAVGAAENERPDRGIYSDNPGELAFFSSRGNTPDGRLKPDVVAPGTWVLSTRSAIAPPFPPGLALAGPYDDHYEFMSGTSMATPITAGSAALVRQYFTEVKHITPAASLIKAALINGADDLGDGWMSTHQGWGRINLTNSLYPMDGRVNWHENEVVSLSLGQVREYSFWVESGQIFKSSLVWSDPPSSLAAAQNLVNNLDLTVVAPDGTVYPGNCFSADRKGAAAGCPADGVNNVEGVYIAAPAAGSYTVRVTASRIDPSFGPQPYSLVVSGRQIASGGEIDCSAAAAGSMRMEPARLNPAKQPEREPGLTSIFEIGNRCAKAVVGSDGLFNFGLYQPSLDLWYNTSYSWPSPPWSSFSTVRVDGQNYVYGGGGFVEPPNNLDSNTNVALWRMGEIAVRQRIEIAQNPATGRPDAAAIRYTMTNAGGNAHQVGMRVMIDTMLNHNDGAPFRLPGAGGAMEAVTQERDYLGAAVPDYWQAFEDLSDPQIAAQMTMRGGDATPPDRLAIAYWGTIDGTLWDYTVNPSRSVTSDSAVGMWWNESPLAPGESRSIVVYYGRPQVEAARGLTLSCPASIQHEEWSEHPFNIAAYFTNTTGATYPDVSMEVITDLTKVDGDPVHSLGNIGPGASGSTTWRLQPAAPGTYGVTVKVWQNLGGRAVLVEQGECSVTALDPAVPGNIAISGPVGEAGDGTPTMPRCQPLTVTADYSGLPVEAVTLVATDADGTTYTAAMARDGIGHWSLTFVPCAVGLWESPLTIRLIATVTGQPDIEQEFEVILIDPSGLIYNEAMGLGWTLPGATVTLQYFDPSLAAWVTLTEEGYPGRFSPVNNPEITGSTGWFGWDAAAGDYRVRVSRPGFADATSGSRTIPPPVTDLNVGLTPTDAVAPVVAYAGVADGGSYPGAVTVQLTATDTGDSGVRYIAYSLDGGAEVEVAGDVAAVAVAAAGAHTLAFRAVDHAGNGSSVQTIGFTIGCSETAPSLVWLPPLSASAPAQIGAGETLPIRFQWQQCGVHVRDQSVIVRIRNAQTNQLITGFAYGGGVMIDDAAGLYGVDFRPSQYNVQPGTRLKVMVYFGSRLKGTSLVDVQ